MNRTTPLLLIALLALLIPPAIAGPIPSDGPRLGGTIAPDGTLLGLWTTTPNGLTEFVGTGSTLRTDELHVITYAPLASTREGQITLDLVWEEQQTRTVETVTPDGQIATTQETYWNTTDTQSVAVSALANALENTELSLTSHQGQRLTITYAGLDRTDDPFTFTVARLTHDTSVVYAKLPRQTLQDQYVEHGQVLLLALAASALGVFGSRWAYRRAGGHVPDLHPALWAVALVLVGALILGLWQNSRESLVLKGAAPLVAGLALTVAFLTLQVWREEGARWLFVRYAPQPGATQPEVRMWSRVVPADQSADRHALSESPRDYQYLDTTWAGFFLRLLGARTYLALPDDRKWFYSVDNGATGYDRVYVLNDDMPHTPRARFYLERSEGQWWPRLRFDDHISTELPLCHYAYDETFIQVISDQIELGAVADKYGELKTQNARLSAALETESIDRGRALMTEHLRAAYAARMNEEIEENADFFQFRRRTVPKVPTPPTSNGGPA